MNQLTLPTARARNSDPETSKAAAASIGKGVEEAVMRVHETRRVGHAWARVPDHGRIKGWRCVRCGYEALTYDKQRSWPPCPIAGLTDDELVRALPDLHPPSVKSARSRLTRGPSPRLRDSGRTRPSNRGRQQIVWRIT